MDLFICTIQNNSITVIVIGVDICAAIVIVITTTTSIPVASRKPSRARTRYNVSRHESEKGRPSDRRVPEQLQKYDPR